jgi:hypothetical protein
MVANRIEKSFVDDEERKRAPMTFDVVRNAKCANLQGQATAS